MKTTLKWCGLLVFSFFLPFPIVPAETAFPQSLPRYRIALTFDDGPRPGTTSLLQEMLARHNVKATFFLVGQMVFKHPQLALDLANAGHELAGHSWSHSDVKTMSVHTLKMELDLTRIHIKEITGQDPRLYRPPGGTEQFFRTKFLPPEGYELVLWDVHSLDHEGLSAEEIVRRVESQVKDGDIVLLHNNLATTVQALNTFIPHLKARGFEFVTVSELRVRDNLASAAVLPVP